MVRRVDEYKLMRLFLLQLIGINNNLLLPFFLSPRPERKISLSKGTLKLFVPPLLRTLFLFTCSAILFTFPRYIQIDLNIFHSVLCLGLIFMDSAQSELSRRCIVQYVNSSAVCAARERCTKICSPLLRVHVP